MKTLIYERVVSAPSDVVWNVVSDVADYARYAPNIDHSKVVSGSGVGMLRECANKDGRWAEKCTEWTEGKRFAFDVQTQAKEYPYPFRKLSAVWSVSAVDAGTTSIRMEFNVVCNSKLFEFFVFPLMKRQFAGVCRTLLDNWQRKVES